MPKTDNQQLADLLQSANERMEAAKTDISFDLKDEPYHQDWMINILDDANEFEAINAIPADMLRALLSSGHLEFYISNIRGLVNNSEQRGNRAGRAALQYELRHLLAITS